MEHDLRKIHGSTVVREVLNLFDSNSLTEGDRILLPCNYSIRCNAQNRAEMYNEAANVQGYTAGKDYSV